MLMMKKYIILNIWVVCAYFLITYCGLTWLTIASDVIVIASPSSMNLKNRKYLNGPKNMY